VLANFYDNEDPIVTGILLLRKTPFYNVDCLHMAIQADSKEFISHLCVQKVLNVIWNGNIAHTVGIKDNINVNKLEHMFVII
jgi:hypothetical protein